MRQIKFRAWDGDKMYYPSDNENEYELSMDGDFWCIQEQVPYDNPDCYANSEDDNDLMQFTGLQDKNRTDIYEGDVLKHHGIVAWNNEEYRWSCIDLNWNIRREWHDIDYLTSPFEVIGNIHENPELLK